MRFLFDQLVELKPGGKYSRRCLNILAGNKIKSSSVCMRHASTHTALSRLQNKSSPAYSGGLRPRRLNQWQAKVIVLRSLCRAYFVRA
jgi:hypothetical protein